MKAIMFSGGVGTRLWPLSRKKTPKQFEKIVGDSSMLQIATKKLFPDFKPEDIFITTGKVYEDIVVKQLPFLPKKNVFTEPEMRDVGPAVGLVAALFSKTMPNEPFVLLWGSDHLVKEEELFRRVLRAAGKIVEKDGNKMVFIAQKPRYANQNLGWISFGDKVMTQDGVNVWQFKGLKYRPDLETTKTFFEDGKHAWNLGYFVTTPAFLWSLFKQFAPDMFSKLKEIQDAYLSPQYEQVLNRIYPTLEKISFDDAILEKLDHTFGYVISENLGWSDVGAWEALKEALEKSPEDNVTHGKVFTKDTKDCLIYNYQDEKLIVGIDLEGMLVINTGDALLIAPKTSVPKVKKVVQGFKGTENEKLT